MAAVTGTAAGDPNIRATHAKTLELTRDTEISERATCVVGVAAELDEHALAALHGRVALTLTAGAESVVVRGRLNPAFRPGDPLVARRAPDVTRNAVIVDADTVAADLPRSFVAQIADGGALVALRVEELPEEAAPGVLVVSPDAAGSGAPADAARALARGERVTVGPDATSVIAAAHDAGHTVLPEPGLPLDEAVRALAPGEAELVERVPAERVAKLLRRSGAARAVIALDHGTPREQYVAWRAGETPEIPGARGRTATLALVQDEGSSPDTTTVSRPEPRTSR
jgi:hypothetical protein